MSFFKSEQVQQDLQSIFSYYQEISSETARLGLMGREEKLEHIEDCKNLGAFIFNPHVLTVEGGGLGVVDADQVKAKIKFDPKGLLNPGKLEGWNIKEQFSI